MRSLKTFEVLLLLVTSINTEKTYDGYQVLETNPMSAEKANALMEGGHMWDFWVPPNSHRGATIFLAPHQLREAETTLKTLGISSKIVIEDMGKIPHYPLEATDGREADGMFSRINTLSQVYAYLDEMAAKYPHLLTLHEAGHSFENRSIKYVKISDGSGSTNSKAIFIDAGIHARERISPPVALYAIFQLVENHSSNKELLNGLDWYILPVLNPDGYEYTFTHDKMWRKNRSDNGNPNCVGVDLNRNFDDHWNRMLGASMNICSEIYCGKAAASEPETQALQGLLMALRPKVMVYLTLHSFGAYMLQPYGYTTEPSQDHEELFSLMKNAADALEKVRGQKYTLGISSKLLYKTSGSSDDWAKNVAGVKYSYTIELPPAGKFFDVSIPEIMPIVTETFEAFRVFGNHVRNLTHTNIL